MAKSSVIGNLRVHLGLDSAQFQTGIQKSSRGLDQMAKRAAAFGAAVGSSMAGALTVMAIQVKRTIDSARAIENSAQVANTGVEEFQRLAYAARTVGVESQKLSDIYKDVNDRIGDFWATGGGPMADFFENIAPKVGITAEAFRDLSGPQALQLYYDTLVKAGASQQDMTFYLEAMASDVTALIPLLRDGGLGFKTLGDEASRFGVVISKETSQSAQAFTANLERIGAAKDGLTVKLTAQLLPALENLSEQFLAFVNDEAAVQAAADGIRHAFEWIAKAAMRITAGIQGMRAEIAALSETGKRLWEFDFSGARDAWNAGQSEAAKIIADMEERIAEGALSATSQGQIQRRISAAFGDAGEEAGAKFTRRLAQSVSGDGGKAAFDALQAEGTRLAESLRTPLETYIAQYDRYRELLKAAAIDQETFNRAVAAAGVAFDEAERAGKKTENVFVSIGQTIAQSFGSAIQGIIDGSRKVGDVIADLMGQLGQMFLNRAFQSLIGFIFPGAGGISLHNLPGNANGTANWRGGITAINERGGEIVDLPKGSRVIPHDVSMAMARNAGERREVNINVNVEGANGDAHVIALVGQGVRTGLREYSRTAGRDMAISAVSDPRVRG